MPHHDCSFLAALDLTGVVTEADSARANHAGDWGTPVDEQVLPDAVVFPESTQDVSTVLAAANHRGVPVTPYAAGTGIEGNATPTHRGISLDLTRMNDVIEVRPRDFQVDVESGVMGSRVETAIADHGLFFPPLPSSGDISTVGGMIATDASGMGTVKYGVIADWVRTVEAVLADGSVISTGSNAVKTSAGYNLRDLLIGSEGTLGVITKATLELAGRPAQIRGGRATFDTLEDAAHAVTDAVQSGVDLAKIELIDRTSARMANAYSETDLPDDPMVFVEFHANHGIGEEIDFCRSVFDAHGVRSMGITDDSAMAELWAARKDLAYAVASFDPSLELYHPGDVTVPISQFPGIVTFVADLATEHDLLIPSFGHAGDGNLHYSILVDPDDPEHVARGETVDEQIIRRAIAVGGTATGEHGVGRGKREHLVPEHGPETVAAMRAIKQALDPKDILNPGKIFPETIGGGRVGNADSESSRGDSRR